MNNNIILLKIPRLKPLLLQAIFLRNPLSLFWTLRQGFYIIPPESEAGKEFRAQG